MSARDGIRRLGLGCCFIVCLAAWNAAALATDQTDQPKGSAYQAQMGQKLGAGLTYGIFVAPARLIRAPVDNWGHPSDIAREMLCAPIMFGLAIIDVLTFPVPGQLGSLTC